MLVWGKLGAVLIANARKTGLPRQISVRRTTMGTVEQNLIGGESLATYPGARLTSPEERESEQRCPQVPDAVVADALTAVVDGPSDDQCSGQQRDVKRPGRHPAKDDQHDRATQVGKPDVDAQRTDVGVGRA